MEAPNPDPPSEPPPPSRSRDESLPPELAALETLLRDEWHPHLSGAVCFLFALFSSFLLAATLSFFASLASPFAPLQYALELLSQAMLTFGGSVFFPFLLTWLEPDASVQRIATLALHSIFWIGGIAILAVGIISIGGLFEALGGVLAILIPLLLAFILWSTQIAWLRRRTPAAAPSNQPIAARTESTDASLEGLPLLFVFDALSLVLLLVLSAFALTTGRVEFFAIGVIVLAALVAYAHRITQQVPSKDPLRQPGSLQRFRDQAKTLLPWILGGTIAFLLAFSIPAGLLYYASTQLAFLTLVLSLLSGFLATPFALAKTRPNPDAGHLQLATFIALFPTTILYWLGTQAGPPELLQGWHLALFAPGMILSWLLAGRLDR